MAKIGVLFVAYGQENYYHKSLAPWVIARKETLGGNTFIISCVSVPFKEYQGVDTPEDKTTEFARHDFAAGLIQYLVTEPKFISEAEARNLALKPLLEEKCDWIVCLDADEVMEICQIEKMLQFVEKNRLINSFNLNYKNYVFTTKQYYHQYFPNRIFSTKKLVGFFDDCYVKYEGNIDFRHLSSINVPPHIISIAHYTWLDNIRSKNKLEYQMKRWTQDMCSYRWDNESNSLQFNLDYYKRFNIPVPEVITEE